MRSLGHEKKKRFYEKFVGRQLDVLVEQQREPSNGLLKAMSLNYIPLFMDGHDELKNSIQTVTVSRISGNLTVYGNLASARVSV
jgi:tRNA A37 methylthiotransferase MiaB